MLNKPKNYISTVIDTHGRKTVMDLIPDNLKVKPVVGWIKIRQGFYY